MLRKELVLIAGIVVFLATAAVAHLIQTSTDKLIPADAPVNNCFGEAISISGEYAILGAPYDSDNGSFSGAAYILKCDPNSGNWVHKTKLTSSGEVAPDQDQFGGSVSISGSYAVIGAHNNEGESYSGSAYVFKHDPNSDTWTQLDRLLPADAGNLDNVGASVSVSGQYAIVGAPLHYIGNQAGAAYIFAPNDTDPNNWQEQQKLLGSDTVVGDQFGRAVFISGDYAFVGAPCNDSNGAVYVFKRSGEVWTEQIKLVPSDADGNFDLFGSSVFVSGEYCIVGMPYDDDIEIDLGSAYVFKRDGESWSEQAKLTPLFASAGADFGKSVCISDQYAAVGAPYDAENVTTSGAAFIFKRDGTSWMPYPPNPAKLIAFDGLASSQLGWSIVLSGDSIVAGTLSASSAHVFRICPPVDFNGDCAVDFADFAGFAQYWLQ